MIARRDRGFTLIELMLVIGMVGIMAGLAIGFSGSWRRKQDFRTLNREVFNVVSVARAKAIRLGKTTKAHFDDTTGTVVAFIDADNNNTFESGEEELYFHDNGADDAISLTSDTLTAANGAVTLIFNHEGYCVDKDGNFMGPTVTIADTQISATAYIDVTIAGAIRLRK